MAVAIHVPSMLSMKFKMLINIEIAKIDVILGFIY